MSERDTLILESAYRVFARFGIAKTTMADIATEAGVARQTVYNAYQNKEDLLRAVIRKGVLQTEGRLKEAWASSNDFETNIQLFFDLVPLNWYDSVQESPQAADLVDGIHRIAGAELDDAGLRYKALIAELIETHFNTAAVDVEALADFFYVTAANAKVGVASRKALETRLSFLKQSVLAILSADET